MRSFSVLDYLIEDRVLFLFKFQSITLVVASLAGLASCLFLTSILATWIRPHSLLSPVYQGCNSIIKYSFNSKLCGPAQIILDFAFQEAVIHATQKISNIIIFTFLAL